MIPADDQELGLLHRAVVAMTTRAKFAVAFGGLATGNGVSLSMYAGTSGQSLKGLFIETREGLGGKALSTRSLAATINYQHATSITRRYEREVAAEGIVTLVALPVVVEGSVRAIVYGGHRVETRLGGDDLRLAAGVVRSLAWEFSVRDEVERRIAVIETERNLAESANSSGIDFPSLRQQFAELREIVNSIDDPETRSRLERVANRMVRSPVSRVAISMPLTPREIDVLSIVALGCRNAQIANRLGLKETTVKAYLSSAMRKLAATSRFDAVLRARSLSLIP